MAINARIWGAGLIIKGREQIDKIRGEKKKELQEALWKQKAKSEKRPEK
jgi:hypothetical protein